MGFYRDLKASSMHFLIKLFPEIIVKSPTVRKRMTRTLKQNIKKVLRDLSPDLEVTHDWEKIEVKLSGEDAKVRCELVNRLTHTPGIVKFNEVVGTEFLGLDQAAVFARENLNDALDGKLFCVRVKRHGNHDFKSTDAERSIGSYLMLNTGARGVKLKAPDVQVDLEIKHSQIFFMGEEWLGLGGYPLGEQDSVLSLISGGFDSTVASYQTIKRGLTTHYLFFNLGGRAHEVGVKEVAHYIWEKYSVSHPVSFITVPFESVVGEILQNIPKSYMGVALKRMMYRAADRLAEHYGYSALVTGEAVAQVSSQTLANLRVIDSVTNTLILRPLVTSNKNEIIQTARDIGTEDFAASMPEYCGVISSHPTTHARPHIIEDAETSFDFQVLEDAIAQHRREDIRNVLSNIEEIPVDIYDSPKVGTRIVDVRHPDEVSKKPLLIDGEPVEEVPYFRLQKEFTDLDSKITYLLYCDRGVMSRLHAELLIDSGFRNVGVYAPKAL